MPNAGWPKHRPIEPSRFAGSEAEPAVAERGEQHQLKDYFD
jgi:hypothetical protein